MTISRTYQRIYDTVKQIPQGKVATYGQIAELAGYPRQARMVGYALHSTPAEIDIPWHRVINSQGEISLRGSGAGELQKVLLENEGIKFTSSGKISLAKYRWGA
jgi:methylated-DNA-protein-cysteine methyltransferase related protein